MTDLVQKLVGALEAVMPHALVIINENHPATKAARAALTAPAAEVPEAMGEEQIVKCLVEASCIGVVKMSYDAGPYQITRPSINADKFARALIATRDAQWQSTRLRGGVPEGWSITRKDDGRIVVKAPNGDAWAWANEHSTGTSNDFVYAFLSALTAAPQAPAAALDAGVVLVSRDLIRRAQQAINWHLEPDSPDEYEATMLELKAIGWPDAAMSTQAGGDA